MIYGTTYDNLIIIHILDDCNHSETIGIPNINPPFHTPSHPRPVTRERSLLVRPLFRTIQPPEAPFAAPMVPPPYNPVRISRMGNCQKGPDRT